MNPENSELAWTRQPGIRFPLKTDEDGTPLHPLTGSRMIESPPGSGTWRDPWSVTMDKMMMEASRRMGEAMLRDLDYPWLRKYRSPWPDAGFNPHARTYPVPEPDYCDECGRPYDD